MSLAMPDLKAAPARILVVGDGDSPVARGLRDLGHKVDEIPASDFHGVEPRMADVVTVLPDCPDPSRVGAVATACAKCVWFQERPAPAGLGELLKAAGVKLVERMDILTEAVP